MPSSRSLGHYRTGGLLQPEIEQVYSIVAVLLGAPAGQSPLFDALVQSRAEPAGNAKGRRGAYSLGRWERERIIASICAI